ncbi:MAG TPA: substrate-binding domain-containing protein [Ramlibacter sp.]|nr:substrate-binding domain-containing protein [Ramlibacter sp.]
MALRLLSGGAAQALVAKMKGPRDVQGTFGAVGAMRDKLLAGEACDVLILTQALVDELTKQGHVVAGSARPLGVVKTGVAVKSGEPAPDVSTPDALKAALKKASGVYFPDPQKATAGIHFMKVLKSLGVDGELKDRIHNFPNGALSMGEMAGSGERGAIGCTQVTEILHVQGVTLVGLLPKEFELATVYTAAVCATAKSPEDARAFVQLLAGDTAASARAECGFER